MVRSLPTILMNRDGGTNFTLSEDTYYQFPLGSSHVNYIDSDYYTVVSAGKIEILKDGIYNIAGGLSSSNLAPIYIACSSWIILTSDSSVGIAL